MGYDAIPNYRAVCINEYLEFKVRVVVLKQESYLAVSKVDIPGRGIS